MERKLINRLGFTPLRLALVAVLALTLAYLIFYPGDTATPQATNLPRKVETQKKRLGANPQDQATPVEKMVEVPPVNRGSEIKLNEVLKYDPFARSDKLSKLVLRLADEGEGAKKDIAINDRQERARQILSELRSKGVKMILVGEKEKIALVGDRPIRVGDLVEGLRVISITPQGVTLSEKEASRD